MPNPTKRRTELAVAGQLQRLVSGRGYLDEFVVSGYARFDQLRLRLQQHRCRAPSQLREEERRMDSVKG